MKTYLVLILTVLTLSSCSFEEDSEYGSRATVPEIKNPYSSNTPLTSSENEIPSIDEITTVASIELKNQDKEITRESDNSFRIYGETTDNCSKVVVETYDNAGGLYDQYQLSQYKYGNTSFKYGIREDWNNLKEGQNTYKFKAYCDNNQIKEATTTLLYSPTPSLEKQSQYNFESQDDSYNGLSNDNYYTNSEGDSVHSPAYSDTTPAGASAICRDGTYSFSRSRRGTCSHHGGVASWL